MSLLVLQACNSTFVKEIHIKHPAENFKHKKLKYVVIKEIKFVVSTFCQKARNQVL